VVCEVLQRHAACSFPCSLHGRFDGHPSGPDAAAANHVIVTPTSGLERAQVKWFIDCVDWVFNPSDGSPDIFVHMETLRRFGITELRPAIRAGTLRTGPKGLRQRRCTRRVSFGAVRTGARSAAFLGHHESAPASCCRKSAWRVGPSWQPLSLRRGPTSPNPPSSADLDRQQTGVHAVQVEMRSHLRKDTA